MIITRPAQTTVPILAAASPFKPTQELPILPPATADTRLAARRFNTVLRLWSDPNQIQHAGRLIQWPHGLLNIPSTEILPEIDSVYQQIADNNITPGFHVPGQSQMTSRTLKQLPLSSLVFYNTGMSPIDLWAVLTGNAHDRTFPFSTMSTYQYTRVDDGPLLKSILAFAVRRHAANVTFELMMPAWNYLLFLSHYPEALDVNTNYVGIGHNHLSTFIAYATRVGRVRILALPGTEKDPVWPQCERLIKQRNIEPVMAKGGDFLDTLASLHINDEASAKATIKSWVESFIGPLTSERRNIAAVIQETAKDISFTPETNVYSDQAMQAIAEHSGLPIDIIRSYYAEMRQH